MKYRTLYKYLKFDPEGSLKILTENTMRFSHPNDFNDPFDCSPAIAQDAATVLWKRSLSKLRRMRPIGYKPAKYVRDKHKVIKRFSTDLKSGEYWNKLIDVMGIACLTEDPANLLMWAHYADNHRGFVVEFKIPEEAEDMRTYDALKQHMAQNFGYYLIPIPVQYVDDRFVMFTNCDDLRKEGSDACLTKSTHWAYEKEHRCIDYLRGPGIHPFDPKLISCVITGSRMPAEHRSALQAAIDGHNQKNSVAVKLHHAVEHPQKFEIYIPGHTAAT